VDHLGAAGRKTATEKLDEPLVPGRGVRTLAQVEPARTDRNRLSAHLAAPTRTSATAAVVFDHDESDDSTGEIRKLSSLVEISQALSSSLNLSASLPAVLDILERHHFAVLTGPPEMGKTAIARMLGLALLSDGWAVHECTRPEQVWERLDPERKQLFVADDAFGSAEYRPDAAERWARDLDRALRATDEHHWLVWTSRPAPLHSGLRRIHRERGGERFPQPAAVQVDAADLSPPEKTLILYRHTRAADLTPAQRRLTYEHGAAIVAHPHFTPERIRRFVAGRLRELDKGADVSAVVDAELSEPTQAMATSYAALAEEHRELLLAMLDSPPGPVAERDLAAALRRHASSGLSHAPVDLVDRLTDHFVRVLR